MRSPAFERVSQELERRTALGRLEARGTVRLALKAAGLDPRSVTPDQMGVVLERVMPGELRSRAVEDAQAICAALSQALAGLEPSPSHKQSASPEEIFRRLAGS